MGEPDKADCCGNCRFWKAGKPKSEYGPCRRHSQQLQIGSDYHNGNVLHCSEFGWPPMKPDEWCGEHEDAGDVADSGK